ncbi:MAG: sensor histidine kinase [Chloroflexi bacterium]|nr:MAG: sensor histidine kinase [Chloroflexota bacterium]
MVTLTDVLEVNWIILYFVYGQVFFITGLVTGLQWRRGSDLELARPLPWLAAFGIAHGLNEWGYIFIPLQAVYLQDAVVRLMLIAHILLLAASFFFLLQFGVELVLPQATRFRWLRALPAAVLLLWGLAVVIRGSSAQDPIATLFAIGDGWSRYFLAFPGALLAAVGLWHQARKARRRNLGRIARHLTGAAAAFAVYALVGGLMVPVSPIFPANVFNYDLLDRVLHLPAAVLRSVCGLGMAFYVVRSLEIFQVETERRLAEMEQAQILMADRERIGRDLHDGIIQNIYAAGLSLEETYHLVRESPERGQQQIRGVMAVLNRTIDDIRRYIFDLRTAEQTRELEKLLESLVQDLRVDTMLEVDLEVVGQRCCVLDGGRVEQITQIAREALSNVVQHSGATRVTLRLTYAGDITRLIVTDNGRGLDPSLPAASGRNGQGIANMQARAEIMGGDLQVVSGPGAGVCLTLSVPCGSSRDEMELEKT